MSQEKYWINVVCKDHAMRGVSGGFMQANHGKEAPLKRMKPGDWVIFYSSKISMAGEEKCQAFTAIGQAIDRPVYQYPMSPDFVPFRRDIHFYKSQEASILSLIPQLEFIENKQRWGFRFRYGFFEINKNDFTLISHQMLME